MHPSVEQLLEFSNQDPSSEIAKHLRECLSCRDQLDSFYRTRDRLRALPNLDPSNEAWLAIRSEVQSPRGEPRRLTWYVAAAASVAVLAVLVLTLMDSSELPEQPTAVAENADANEQIAKLMAQSRQLDMMLQGLPNRPRVERVAMAATLDTIEDRIQWLDVQLNYASASELDDMQTQTLWRERVELMDSLVKVRYAQTGRVSF